MNINTGQRRQDARISRWALHSNVRLVGGRLRKMYVHILLSHMRSLLGDWRAPAGCTGVVRRLVLRRVSAQSHPIRWTAAILVRTVLGSVLDSEAVRRRVGVLPRLPLVDMLSVLRHDSRTRTATGSEGKGKDWRRSSNDDETTACDSHALENVRI